MSLPAYLPCPPYTHFMFHYVVSATIGPLSLPKLEGRFYTKNRVHIDPSWELSLSYKHPFLQKEISWYINFDDRPTLVCTASCIVPILMYLKWPGEGFRLPGCCLHATDVALCKLANAGNHKSANRKCNLFYSNSHFFIFTCLFF